MRHKDFGTTSGYIAAGEAWSQSGLKGIFADGEKEAASWAAARPAHEVV